MRSRWLALGVVALGVAGCGQDHIGTPRLPLVGGAQVIAQARQCDKGSNVFCALELVVTDSQYPSAQAMMTAQRQHLRSLGWAVQETEVGQEQSAVSPGQKYRLVYATAPGDLLAVDEGWVNRPQSIAQALSKTIFDRTPAMSLMLEAGPS
jgi:hypothetical protein